MGARTKAKKKANAKRANQKEKVKTKAMANAARQHPDPQHALTLQDQQQKGKRVRQQYVIFTQGANAVTEINVPCCIFQHVVSMQRVNAFVGTHATMHT